MTAQHWRRHGNALVREIGLRDFEEAMAFMQRVAEGHGFTPMTSEVAAEHAKRRVELGYVNLYPAFRETK